MPKRPGQDPCTRVSWKEKKKKRKEQKDRKWDREAERLTRERQSSEKADQPPVSEPVVRHTDRPPAQLSAGREWTVSIALPASIADNAQSAELRTYLAGQIARAAAIFNIDEVVLYDEYCASDPLDERKRSLSFMAKVLQYLECPQYLRKFLFPIQKDLQYAGLLNPLDCRHHLKTTDLTTPFREGVVLRNEVSDRRPDSGSSVYIGLDQRVRLDRVLLPGVRVTVQLDPDQLTPSTSKDHVVNVTKRKSIAGHAVSPSAPRTELGLYWGYTVRVADSLSHALRDSPFPGGYDLVLGTSERGDSVDQVAERLPQSFKHAIIFFGGLGGIEPAVDSDVRLSHVSDPRSLFHFYLNTCPGQGSNTIRTEEAILITLSCLRSRLLSRKLEQ